MFDFHYDVSGKLREIFKQHCNLSLEQYEEITIQLVDLVDMIRYKNPEYDIQEQIYRLSVIFDFLLSTKELTLQEHYSANDGKGTGNGPIHILSENAEKRG